MSPAVSFLPFPIGVPVKRERRDQLVALPPTGTPWPAASLVLAHDEHEEEAARRARNGTAQRLRRPRRQAQCFADRDRGNGGDARAAIWAHADCGDALHAPICGDVLEECPAVQRSREVARGH